MKAADIPDATFVAAVVEAARLRNSPTADRWAIACVLAGRPEDVGVNFDGYPHMPNKVVLAKARKLVLRGLLSGCACGCRGDFEPVDEVAP